VTERRSFLYVFVGMRGQFIPTLYYDDRPTKYQLRGLPFLFASVELTNSRLADSTLAECAAWFAMAQELGMTAVPR
jgi:hypothetical protein